MGELGRNGPQLPHDEPAQRAHVKEVDEDLRADQEADRLAKGRSTRPRWGVGYLVVLAGSAGFVASSFVPYYGGGVGPGFGTVSLYQQGSFGDSVGWYLGSLLFLFGGVATVALLAIAGVTRRGTPHRSDHARRDGCGMVVDVDRSHDPRHHVRARGHAGVGLLGPCRERRRGGHRDHRCGGHRKGRSAFRGRDVARPAGSPCLARLPMRPIAVAMSTKALTDRLRSSAASERPARLAPGCTRSWAFQASGVGA